MRHAENGYPTYYVRSSVLGEVAAEYDAAGQWRRGYGPSVATVVILSAPCQPPDLRGVADERAVAEALYQLDEPGAVATRLDADDHLTGECGIEPADIIPLVIQLVEADSTFGRVAVTNSLLTRVGVHPTIDRHGHLVRKVSLPRLSV